MNPVSIPDRIQEIFGNPKTSSDAKRKAAELYIEELTKERTQLSAKITAGESYEKWKMTTPCHLQKNDCSRLHKLLDDIQHDRTILADREPTLIRLSAMTLHPFVIQHNWAAVFEGAEDYINGDFNLPYNDCAFEFRINDRNVTIIACAVQDEIEYFCFVESEKVWVGSGSNHERQDNWYPFAKLAVATIRAVCIALDAEVAQHNVVRAPSQLNRKRIESGKLPIFDYHVVFANREKKN